MDHILADLSPGALAIAVKANLHDFLRYLGRATQTASFDDPGLDRWHTRVPFPWFNGVLSSRPVTDGDEERIRDAVAWFAARSVRPFTWWLRPMLPSADWVRLLERHDFHLSDGPPGMAVDLRRIDEAERDAPGFQVLPVTDMETLRAWTRTFVMGYGMPSAWEAPALDMMRRLGSSLPMRNYLGCLYGRPVATSNLFLGAGVAGLQFVATLPEARGRGIGRAMTVAALLDARRMGYRIGTLQASEMGFPIYERLGFQQVCQVEHLVWNGRA